MQLRRTMGLGVLAAAWLVAACPRYARQPPPPSAQQSTSTGVTVAAATSAERPVRSEQPAVPGPTCISGIIKTSMEIPVARAHVVVSRGSTLLGDATTDDNGHFNWCASRALGGSTVRANVLVEKAAFSTSERQLDLPVGTTSDVNIGLNPVQ